MKRVAYKSEYGIFHNSVRTQNMYGCIYVLVIEFNQELCEQDVFLMSESMLFSSAELLSICPTRAQEIRFRALPGQLINVTFLGSNLSGEFNSNVQLEDRISDEIQSLSSLAQTGHVMSTKGHVLSLKIPRNFDLENVVFALQLKGNWSNYPIILSHYVTTVFILRSMHVCFCFVFSVRM